MNKGFSNRFIAIFTFQYLRFRGLPNSFVIVYILVYLETHVETIDLR